MEPTKETRGRPRDENIRIKVLKNTLSLLKSYPLPKVTAEAIAKRAGVSKSTLYRWWPNKSAIIFDAFLELVEPKIRFDITDDPDFDLKQQMYKIAQVYQKGQGRIFLSLIAQSQFDDELAGELLKFVKQRREAAGIALNRALLTRGIQKTGEDLSIALDLLYAPIFYRLLIPYGRVDKEFVNSVHKIAMKGLLETKIGE